MKWQGFRVNSVCSPFGQLHCHCCHRYRHSHCSPPSSEMMNELLNCQFSFTCSSLQSLLLLLLLLYTCSSNYPCGVACPASNWRGMRSISTAASELPSTEVRELNCEWSRCNESMSILLTQKQADQGQAITFPSFLPSFNLSSARWATYLLLSQCFRLPRGL